MHRLGLLHIVLAFALLPATVAVKAFAQQSGTPRIASEADPGWTSAIRPASSEDAVGGTTISFGNPHISDVERWSDPPGPFPANADPVTTEERAPEAANTVVVEEPPPALPEEPAASAAPATAGVETPEPPVVAAETPVEPPAGTSPIAGTPADDVPPPTPVAASPVDVEPLQFFSTEGERELRTVSVSGWSSNVFPGDQQAVTQIDMRILAIMESLAGHMRHLKFEREFTMFLMGLALLSGLLSGVGWFASRNRRTRAIALRSGESRAVAFRPAGGMLVPADERMCSELCRTAHSMLTQIDTRVDDLQAVAPLRRVLQREMRHLEQFLTAVMAANPAEAEEWRRMRNRLQRIVKELHRLQEIVEGARRSLTSSGFGATEPPRDKNEAYAALGVNADVDQRTLKRLVDALRACWHPDHAKDEADRLTREERIKRINIAWDIITEKRQEA